MPSLFLFNFGHVDYRHHDFGEMSHGFVGKFYHGREKSIAVDSHQLSILFRVNGVEANGHAVDQSDELWNDVPSVDDTAVTVRVEPDSAATALDPPCHLLDHIQANCRFSVSTEYDFVIVCRFSDGFNHFLGGGFSLNPEKCPLTIASPLRSQNTQSASQRIVIFK